MLVHTHHAICSSLEVCRTVKNINFWKLIPAGFHAISTCRPVKTSFQVDIGIYDDKLGQSGDRILSSHITNNIIYLQKQGISLKKVNGAY